MPENDIPAGQEEAPAEAPAPITAEQIAAIVSTAIDARIPGLQSGYDTRINDLETKLRQSNMDEDEIADEANKTLAAQLAAEQAKNASLQAAQVYPDAYPVFEKLQAASTAEEQLKLVNDLISQASAPAAPTSPAEGNASPEPDAHVDPNQAPTDPALDPNGMNEDKANRIIDAFGDRWPGR